LNHLKWNNPEQFLQNHDIHQEKIQFYQDQFEHKREFERPDRIKLRQFWQFQSNSIHLQIGHNNFLSLKIKRQVQSGRSWVVRLDLTKDINWTACESGRSKIQKLSSVSKKSIKNRPRYWWFPWTNVLRSMWTVLEYPQVKVDGCLRHKLEGLKFYDEFIYGTSTLDCLIETRKYFQFGNISWKDQSWWPTLTNWIWFEIICSLTSPNSRLRPTINKFNTCTVSSSAKTLIEVSTESLVNTFGQGIWLGLANLRRVLF